MKTDELFVDDSYPSDDALSEIEKKAACDEAQTAEDGFPDMENTFQLYWEEVSRIPCLAAEQERKLFLRIAEGDEKAKNDVIKANLRLVVSIAVKYKKSPLDFPTLVQEGNLGLIKAVEMFDGSRGFRFSTYATWWIRKYILGAINKQGRLIVLPDAVLARIRKLNDTTEQLEKKYGGTPTDELLAYSLGTTVEKIIEIKRLASEIIFPLDILPGEQVEDDGS